MTVCSVYQIIIVIILWLVKWFGGFNDLIPFVVKPNIIVIKTILTYFQLMSPNELPIN